MSDGGFEAMKDGSLEILVAQGYKGSIHKEHRIVVVILVVERRGFVRTGHSLQPSLLHFGGSSGGQSKTSFTGEADVGIVG